MTTQSSVFTSNTSKEHLTHEQVQEKYKECSTQHGLTQGQTGQVTKAYGCNQCKVYFHKDANGWHMNKLQPAHYHLFGFKEEIIFSKEDEAKAQNLELLISEIPKGQIVEITKQNMKEKEYGLLDLYNFVIKYKDHQRFKNAKIEPIRGIIKITKK